MIDTRNQFTGLIAAPLAPMDKNGQLRPEVVGEYARFLHRQGVQGVFLNGTSGEGVSLRRAERKELTQAWIEESPDDFRVVVNVSHTSIYRSQELAIFAAEMGADGISSMSAFFYRPATLERLVEYCQTIAAVVPDTPFYYYHIPVMTGVDYPMVDFLKRAADQIPNLAGIKYTKENRVDFEMSRLVNEGKFNILSGCDDMLVSTYSSGCKGFIGSTYNYAAPLFLEMMRLFDTGQVQQANALQADLVDVINVMAKSGDYFASAKRVMEELGVKCGGVRLPLQPVPDVQLDAMMRELEALKFFEKIQSATK